MSSDISSWRDGDDLPYNTPTLKSENGFVPCLNSDIEKEIGDSNSGIKEINAISTTHNLTSQLESGATETDKRKTKNHDSPLWDKENDVMSTVNDLTSQEESDPNLKDGLKTANGNIQTWTDQINTIPTVDNLKSQFVLSLSLKDELKVENYDSHSWIEDESMAMHNDNIVNSFGLQSEQHTNRFESGSKENMNIDGDTSNEIPVQLLTSNDASEIAQLKERKIEFKCKQCFYFVNVHLFV